MTSAPFFGPFLRRLSPYFRFYFFLFRIPIGHIIRFGHLFQGLLAFPLQDVLLIEDQSNRRDG